MRHHYFKFCISVADSTDLRSAECVHISDEIKEEPYNNLWLCERCPLYLNFYDIARSFKAGWMIRQCLKLSAKTTSGHYPIRLFLVNNSICSDCPVIESNSSKPPQVEFWHNWMHESPHEFPISFFLEQQILKTISFAKSQKISWTSIQSYLLTCLLLSYLCKGCGDCCHHLIFLFKKVCDLPSANIQSFHWRSVTKKISFKDLLVRFFWLEMQNLHFVCCVSSSQIEIMEPLRKISMVF